MPKNLAETQANGDLLAQFSFRGKRLADEVSVEGLCAAVNALSDKLQWLAAPQAPTPQDNRSPHQKLQDAGVRPESGRATPDSRSEDDRRAKATADKLKNDVNRLQRLAAYQRAKNDAEAEAAMLPHSRRAGKHAELMSKVRRDFPDVAA